MINWILGISLIAMGVVLGFTLGCAYMGRPKFEAQFSWSCGVCSMRFEISGNDYKTVQHFRKRHLESHGSS